MSEQIKLFFWHNQNLFSNNYLQYRLPSTELWDRQRENAEKAFQEAKKYYEAIKDLKIGSGQEKELEDKFIRPVLNALGYVYHVEPVTKRGYKKKRPDFALFKDTQSHKSACSERDYPEKFFSLALTILESKYWGRCLNDTDKGDILDSRDPTAQTVKYLDDVHYHTDGRINWAILTNGKNWRLFYYRAASRAGNFFEADLEEIITNGDIDKFLYFYLFFSRDAFVPDPSTGKTWLDQHLKGSEEYAVRVSTKLKDLIFDKVFEGLAEGFVHYRRYELSIEKETDDNRRDIFKGCLTLLYRLLFLLYAESRNLLPVDEDAYKKVSLLRLKQDIHNDLFTMGIDKLSKRSYSYWARFGSLFDIIAKGDPALNVPVYNGGLFDTPGDSFLSIHKIPDPFIAEAIELLTIDQETESAQGKKPFIDYSSLNVRHLGDIYEGLLEFHVQIADEDIFEVREKGKSLWKKATETKESVKTYRKKSIGEVYIENSKHERKATGSYYTPHYIVEYIVKNTVGPVLEERLKAVKDLLSELEDSIKAKRRQKSASNIKGYIARIQGIEDSIFNTLFDIKVLDPAMGSGHFLVHTVDFISDRIVSFLADFPENPVIRKIAELKKEILKEIDRQGVRIDETKLTEVNLIKRMVMKRCIYGVDLNNMAVELAKLSLWLDSFTLGAPLSFLDHHLKCGNSLIGVLNISNVILSKISSSSDKSFIFPESALFSKIKRSLAFMIQVSELTDATITEAKESSNLFKHAQHEIEPVRRRLDVATARYFIDLGTSLGRVEQLAYNMDFDKESYPEIVEKCKKALNIAIDRNFFHWSLEFPEVFYTEKGEKENPGFDCVIGNPPYGLVNEKSYVKTNFVFTSQNFDLYAAFIEMAIRLLKKNGLHSFIVPTSWQTGILFESLRNILIEQYSFNKLINLPFNVFQDAFIDTGVHVLQKTPYKETSTNVLSYEFPKYSKIETLDFIKYSKIDQCLWQQAGNKIILDASTLNLLRKINSSNVTELRDITKSARGVLAKPEHILLERKHNSQPFFDGEMYRFKMTSPDKFIIYSEDLPESPSSFDFFTGHRLLIRRLVSRQDRIMGHSVTETFVNKKDIYIFKPIQEISTDYLLALLNSKLLSYLYFRTDVVARKDDFRQTTLEGIRSLPIPIISFTTPDQKRKERVSEAIELYRNYMLDLEKGCQEGKAYEKTGTSDTHDSAMERESYSGGEEMLVSGKHPRAGESVNGIRRRASKHKDAKKISEDIEEYTSTTRHIESSLGIKSYSELAPYLAQGVQKVMAGIVNKNPDELRVTPEFVCNLHKDAFVELFPSWAGRYRDRNVTVGSHTPPPYFEIPVLMRQYCDDLESRLTGLGLKPSLTDILYETLAFAEGRFLSIHPFLDFNGRVARMLLFVLLYRLDLPPVQLVPVEKDEDDKIEYLKGLSEGDKFNWLPLMTIWKKRLGVKE